MDLAASWQQGSASWPEVSQVSARCPLKSGLSTHESSPYPRDASHVSIWGCRPTGTSSAFSSCHLPEREVWARAMAGLSLLLAPLGLVEDRWAHCRDGGTGVQPRVHPEWEFISCHCPGATKPHVYVCVGRGPGAVALAGCGCSPDTDHPVTLSPAAHPHQVARSRSGKTFTTGPRESLEEQLKPMIDWAITGFKPLGLKGLRPPKGSGEVVASAGWGLVGGWHGRWPLGAGAG